MNTDIIKVTQLPVIEEQLRALKADVDQRVSAAMALACTPETVQDVKKARAELNKEFADLEARRREVKKAVLGPYEAFEAVYRECVSDQYNAADRALKEKVNAVESAMKQQCEDGLREYFAELAAVNHLDWLPFERVGITVDMASAKQKTPKKLREQIAAFVTRVARDIETIAGMEDAEDLLVEYRTCLDLSAAIHTVDEHHRRVDEAKERLRRHAEDKETEQAAVAKVDAAAPASRIDPPETVRPKLLTITFRATATREKLIKLREFMKQEGIKYE